MDSRFNTHFISDEVWRRANYFESTRLTVEYIAGHFHEQITLEEIAAVACMEKTAFSKAFRKKTGVTFTAFLRAFRVSKAAVRIELSDEPITDVAFSVGFGSLPSFERSFKRLVGCTPAAYRARFLHRLLPPGHGTRREDVK